MRDVSLGDVCPGDIIAFYRCGAYSVTEGMALFLSRELPAVVLVDNEGRWKLLRNIIQINNLNRTQGGIL